MNRILSAAVLFSIVGAGPILAQTAAPSSSATTPAIATGTTNNTTAAPVAGANSFSMSQAQKRIEDQGYTQVSGLAKDDKSIWRGQAMKDGKSVSVAVDYQGNITAN